MPWQREMVALVTVVSLLVCLSASAAAQDPAVFVGMGDSIGEGVQSGDANELTQPFSFLNIVAWRMGAPFPLPLIRTGPFASISSVSGRSRRDPSVLTRNTAVSGADVHSLLTDAADAASVAAIDTETDMVMFPRFGSQIEVAEQLQPQFVACWIGNNNALGAVLAVDHLDASQLTPVASFQSAFAEIASRLNAIGAKVIFATIPDVTTIAFLVDGDDLLRVLGSDHGLPAGSRTTVVTMVAIKADLLPPSVLSDPNYVLDSSEIATINGRIAAFNDIIGNVAAQHGMGVADVGAVYAFLRDHPLTIAGVTLTTRYLQGIFSLDGVHPGNFAQGIAAAIFIETFNAHYGTAIPQLDAATLAALFLTDPFIDKDADGRVQGRPGAGLLETLLALLGVSGDTDDALPSTAVETNAVRFVEELSAATGTDMKRATKQERVSALRWAFGATQKDFRRPN